MKVGGRVVNLLSGLILAIIGVIFFLMAFGRIDLVNDQLQNFSKVDRIWAWIISLITFLLAIFSFVLAFKHRPEEKTIIHQTNFGEVQITVPAMESLALRAVKNVRGVREAHVGIRVDSGLLDVFVEITAHPDLSVPQISEEIRTQVDNYIYETVGIRVNSVKVLVTKVAGESSRARVE